MADRAVVRTLMLSRPLHEAGKEIDELEFYEPSSILFDELERATEWNSHAKKRKSVVSTGMVMLEHLTKLHSSTLEKMTFGDRKKANEVAADIMGNELDLGED